MVVQVLVRRENSWLWPRVRCLCCIFALFALTGRSTIYTYPNESQTHFGWRYGVFLSRPSPRRAGLLSQLTTRSRSKLSKASAFAHLLTDLRTLPQFSRAGSQPNTAQLPGGISRTRCGICYADATRQQFIVLTISTTNWGRQDVRRRSMCESLIPANTY